MNKSLSEQIEEYLKFFMSQPEAGLLIFNSDKETEGVDDFLISKGFMVTNDWAKILNTFKLNQSVALVLGNELTPELYSLIVQYADRAGEIQVMNSGTMILEQVEFNPKICHLLILVTSDILKKIEAKFNLRDKVGLIEIIK